MGTDTDRIEKKVLLHAPRERVWHAISDAKRFGSWFGVDYSKEQATLVTFELAEAAGGTMLTVTESGFDRIPLERRAKAFAANEQGWSAQLKLIEKYLALPA